MEENCFSAYYRKRKATLVPMIHIKTDAYTNTVGEKEANIY